MTANIRKLAMNSESFLTKHGNLINNYEVGLRTVLWSSYTFTFTHGVTVMGAMEDLLH